MTVVPWRTTWLLPAAAIALSLLLVAGCANRSGPTSPGAIPRAPTPSQTSTSPLAFPSEQTLNDAASFREELPPSRQVSLEESVSGARSTADQIPRLRYDLAERARTLGSSVEPLFAFVRDRIRYEAYPGVLRGAEATYLARAGNAADRALLLAAMLTQAGIQTRFAMGRLAGDRVSALFERIFEEPIALEADAAGPGSGSDPDAEAFLSRLRARAARDYARVAPLLSGIKVSATAPVADVRREIEDHVWVQAQINGQWTDLDPSFRDAQVGQRFASDAETTEVLPERLYQQVTVRVIVETLSGTELDTQTALTFTARAAELMEKYVLFVHVQEGGLAGGIAGGIQGPDAWTPGLYVHGSLHTGSPIVFSGGVTPPPQGAAPRGGLPGIFGPRGALRGAAREFVSESLEFLLRLPGGQTGTVRRILVDRADAAWRQSGTHDPAGLRALARDEQGLTDPRTVHNIWFNAGRHDLYAFAQETAELMRALRPADPAALPPAGAPLESLLPPFALQTLPWLIASDHLIIPALNDHPGVRLYSDSPRVVIASYGIDPSQGPGGFVVLYDLRRDHLRAAVREERFAGAARDRKLWFGLLEGALEHEIGALYAAATGSPRSSITSTSTLLDDQGVVLIASGAAAPDIGDPETRARITSAVARGMVLVVPRRILAGGPPAWWELDPASGNLHPVVGDLNLGRYGGSYSGGGGRTNYVDPNTYSSRRAGGRGRPGGTEQQAVTQFAVALTALAGIAVVFIIGFLVYRAYVEVVRPMTSAGNNADRVPR